MITTPAAKKNNSGNHEIVAAVIAVVVVIVVVGVVAIVVIAVVVVVVLLSVVVIVVFVTIIYVCLPDKRTGRRAGRSCLTGAEPRTSWCGGKAGRARAGTDAAPAHARPARRSSAIFILLNELQGY